MTVVQDRLSRIRSMCPRREALGSPQTRSSTSRNPNWSQFWPICEQRSLHRLSSRRCLGGLSREWRGRIDHCAQGEGRSYEISEVRILSPRMAPTAVCANFSTFRWTVFPRCASGLEIHFEANLRHIVRDRPAVLYWILDPSSAGTFIAYDIDRTWVYTPRVTPQQFDREQYSDAHCGELIRKAIGRDDFDLQIGTSCLG